MSKDNSKGEPFNNIKVTNENKKRKRKRKSLKEFSEEELLDEVTNRNKKKFEGKKKLDRIEIYIEKDFSDGNKKIKWNKYEYDYPERVGF
jgi:hypothetical protein